MQKNNESILIKKPGIVEKNIKFLVSWVPDLPALAETQRCRGADQFYLRNHEAMEFSWILGFLINFLEPVSFPQQPDQGG
jgi:hypothetical protein